MAFPIVNIKATNIELTDELSSLVDQKLRPLERFLPENETDMTCDIELEKINDQQSGKVYRAEVNFFIKGITYRADALEDQMEKAIDEMRDEIKKKIRRSNSKKDSLLKRGGRRIKDMMRFGR